MKIRLPAGESGGSHPHECLALRLGIVACLMVAEAIGERPAPFAPAPTP